MRREVRILYAIDDVEVAFDAAPAAVRVCADRGLDSLDVRVAMYDFFATRGSHTGRDIPTPEEFSRWLIRYAERRQRQRRAVGDRRYMTRLRGTR